MQQHMEVAATPKIAPVFYPFRFKKLEYKPKVLLVEDDMTLRPLWSHLIHEVAPGAEIIWTSDAERAECTIQNWASLGQSFDLVISDIFLPGLNTGIDLWMRCKHQTNAMILMTTAAPPIVDAIVDGRLNDLQCLWKPLQPKICKAMLRRMLKVEPLHQ